jgi:hypothetical protein
MKVNNKNRLKLVIGLSVVAASIIAAWYLLFFNSAQYKARIMNSYVRTQHMTKFLSYGDAGKLSDNTIPNYQIYYKTTASEITIKNSLEAFLRSNGYKVKSVLKNEQRFPSINGNKPYWIISGTNKKTTVNAKVTDTTYEDTSSGQKPNPPGYNVLYVEFSSGQVYQLR